ncbi:MAG TPA: acyl-ACP--UDP-N-acetylglucosamine O-acyltransferase [Oceanipulchritudo sp.]|nr:acyl-ACP--UDP-N-acetylglucosamine O-acyltransferase [Oceanipulchritudo sp.]
MEKRHHPTAVIHKATRLAPDVTVGAYAVIEDGVEIGSGSIIREHAVIRAGTVLGEKCVVDAHAVIGGLPQDLGFDPRIPTGVRAGNDVTFRKGVTVSRATKEGAFTELGNDVLLMANCHIGHDCDVGNHVILGNNLLLSGWASVGEHAFVSGGAGIHQFVRIGASAMVGGLARVSQDIPPFCMMSERNRLVGLNLVGLQRRGLGRATIRELKQLYAHVFNFEGRPGVLAGGALADGMAHTPEGRTFLEFLTTPGKKGIMRPASRKES